MLLRRRGEEVCVMGDGRGKGRLAYPVNIPLPAAPISAIDRIPSTPNVGMVVNFNRDRRQRKRPQQRPLFLLRASNQTWLKVVIDKSVGRMQPKARRRRL